MENWHNQDELPISKQTTDSDRVGAHDDVEIEDEQDTAMDEVLHEELLQAFLEPESSEDCTTARQLDMFCPAPVQDTQASQDDDTKNKKRERCEDTEPPTVKKRKKKRNGDTNKVKNEIEQDDALSDYELLRLQNIKRNKAIMKAIGLDWAGVGPY